MTGTGVRIGDGVAGVTPGSVHLIVSLESGKDWLLILCGHLS